MAVEELVRRREELGFPTDSQDMSMEMWGDIERAKGSEWVEWSEVIATRMRKAGDDFLSGNLYAYIDGIPELSGNWHLDLPDD